MKTSSDETSPELAIAHNKQVSARNAFFANLLALPGLGSFLAGQRLVGAAQMLLALVGFGFNLFWFLSFAAQWIKTKEFPLHGGQQFGWGLIGIGLFTLAWLWGLATGLQIRRAARTNNA